MKRRDFLKAVAAGVAAITAHQPGSAPVVVGRPTDQKYVRGDIVRVMGTQHTSTWWADKERGVFKRIRGSYRDLCGNPTFQRVVIVPENSSDFARYEAEDRANYAHECSIYSCENLDGSGGSSWWDERCFELVEYVPKPKQLVTCDDLASLSDSYVYGKASDLTSVLLVTSDNTDGPWEPVKEGKHKRFIAVSAKTIG